MGGETTTILRFRDYISKVWFSQHLGENFKFVSFLGFLLHGVIWFDDLRHHNKTLRCLLRLLVIDERPKCTLVSILFFPIVVFKVFLKCIDGERIICLFSLATSKHSLAFQSFYEF